MDPIRAVVETPLDADDLEAAEAFDRGVLGLEVIGTEPGRHIFFRAGDGVLLAFRPEATPRGDRLPPHGAPEVHRIRAEDDRSRGRRRRVASGRKEC